MRAACERASAKGDMSVPILICSAHLGQGSVKLLARRADAPAANPHTLVSRVVSPGRSLAAVRP